MMVAAACITKSAFFEISNKDCVFAKKFFSYSNYHLPNFKINEITRINYACIKITCFLKKMNL